jgi:hypothetical protein|nr:MAG TPA: DNA/protein translocase of phage P22 injectosome [Caudoviricetes sp.]
MATWNQGINSGGFLAGIGTNNDNAPKASDVNSALAYIRANNEMQRSGQNNIGLQALQSLGTVSQAYQQQNQQDAMKAFNQAQADAWATGDNSGLIKFAQANPAFVTQAQQAVSGLNQQQRDEAGQLAMQANTALFQGPEAFSKFVTSNADGLRRIGVNPTDALQLGINNPQQLSHFANTLAMGAVGPEKMLDYQMQQGKLQQTGQIAQANLNLGQQRLQQQAAYQQGQLNQGQQQLNLTAQKNQADNANKRFELLLKSKDNSAKSQANMQSSVQKMQDYVGAHQSNVNNISGMLDTVNQIKGIGPEPANGQPDQRVKPEVFDRVFGFGGTINSSIPGTESADAWAKIEQMQSQARLMGVIGMKGTGPVSDSEGQAAAKAFMSINQNMSPKAARAAIDNWQRVLQRQAAYLQKQQPTVDSYQQKIDSFNAGQGSPSAGPVIGQSERGYTFLGGDPSNKNNWRKD